MRRLCDGKADSSLDRLLSAEEAATLLGTTVRFPRRLVAERRIRFVHVGRHVRIPLSALEAFVASGTVEPDEFSWSPRGGVA
jgi:excisionase family DNA binding protein